MLIKVVNNQYFQCDGTSFSADLPALESGHYTLYTSTDAVSFNANPKEIDGGTLVVSDIVPGMFFKIGGIAEGVEVPVRK